jgi:hypothetical protein
MHAYCESLPFVLVLGTVDVENCNSQSFLDVLKNTSFPQSPPLRPLLSVVLYLAFGFRVQ